MTRLRELLLTAGAVVGSLCLLVAIVGLVSDVKPLVFRSGSMGPEIPAGSLALARTVVAPDLREGDVVSVITSDGGRVTHRVVRIEGAAGPMRALTLRGDANPSPDAESYTVAAADRVFFTLPGIGHVVALLGSRLGLLMLGGLSVGLVIYAFRPTGRRHGRHAASIVAAPVAAVAVIVGASAGTSAAYVDTATISGSVTSGELASPAPVPDNCTADNGLLASSIVLRWAGVVASGVSPVPTTHEYVLRFFDRSTGAQVGEDVGQMHSGAAGSTQSVTFSSSTLGNLLDLALLGETRLRVEIRSRLLNTEWYGSTVVATNFRSTEVAGVVSFTCNE